VLVLNLLRWGADIRSLEELNLPPVGAKAAGLSDKELAMAKQLVDDMTGKWDPEQFTDSFKDDIMALVKRKAKEGKLENVVQPEEGEEPEARSGAKIIDLTELLQRSLRKGGGDAPKEKPAPKTKAAAKTPARKKPAAKTSAHAPARRRAA
jgi:DNA end-binding protein Ku